MLWLTKSKFLSLKRISFFLPILIILFFISSAGAGVILEQIQIPGSPNPIGSGARAMGMGGAFIAVADDATAASWNPGGLIQLEKLEISIVGAYFDRSVATSIKKYPEASGEWDITEERLNYFSIAYPFKAFNRNMTVSLNYQNLYDFTTKLNFPIYQNQDGLVINQDVDYVMSGSLSAIGLAYCIEVIPDLSFGMTLNLWQPTSFNNNKWKYIIHRTVSGSLSGIYPITGEHIARDTYSFSGINANFGALWNISSRWTLGAVLKTPFKADLKHTRLTNMRIRFTGYPPESDIDYKELFEGNESLTMPLSYGIGIACRLSDSLTVSGDIYRTEWGGFIHQDAKGGKTSPVTGTPESEAGIDATHQVRLGAEYLIIRPSYAIPLRAGVFCDPSPAKGHPDNYFGFSLGSGFAYGNLIFDMAFQYRFGNDIEKSFETFSASQDVKEYTVYSSLIIHF